MARKFNRFQPQTAVFDCRCCGRKSRETARNSGAGDICGACFDLAGIENEISDGYCSALDRKAEILDYTEEVSNAGGSLDNWADLLNLLSAGMAEAPSEEPVPTACPEPNAVVPPQLTLHQSSLVAERALRMAEYANLARRIQTASQDLTQDLASGRVSVHAVINLQRTVADAHALAAVIDQLDRYIVSCQ